MSEPLRITVWNEFRHERSNPAVGRIYPEGIHEALAAPLREAGHAVRTATLDQPGHVAGLATGPGVGYRVVFATAAVWFVLATVMVSRIRGVR